MTQSITERIKAAFYGAAIGDALGVPVEFCSREELAADPVADYRGYGTWNQPPGTFSDDSSLLFCTAESLCRSYDLNDMASTFVRWYTEGYWGAHDTVFDVGGATSNALRRIQNGCSPLRSGGTSENDNGNGSLMRILPMAFFLSAEPSADERFTKIHEVSGITHAHRRSVFACFIYVEYAILLLKGYSRDDAYLQIRVGLTNYLRESASGASELAHFDRILKRDIRDLPPADLRGSGYVIHTLESALWCFLTTDNYSDCVLKAVNLGEDTDTTATVAGGLAGLYYGINGIPRPWIDHLAKSPNIATLAETLAASLLHDI